MVRQINPNHPRIIIRKASEISPPRSQFLNQFSRKKRPAGANRRGQNGQFSAPGKLNGSQKVYFQDRQSVRREKVNSEEEEYRQRINQHGPRERAYRINSPQGLVQLAGILKELRADPQRGPQPQARAKDPMRGHKKREPL